MLTVPQTDSGRRGEYPKARERTLAKELVKLTPLLREKVCLVSWRDLLPVRHRVGEKWGLRLFTKNTGLCELVRGRIGSDACPVLEG